MAFNFLRFSLKYCCKMSFKVEISSIRKEKRRIFSRFTKAVNICYMIRHQFTATYKQRSHSLCGSITSIDVPKFNHHSRARVRIMSCLCVSSKHRLGCCQKRQTLAQKSIQLSFYIQQKNVCKKSCP